MGAYPSASTAILTSPVKKNAFGKADPFTIKHTFDLDELTAKVADGDIFNLFTLPANHTILATRIATTVASVGGTGACTAQLRFGTTAIGAATNILAAAVGTGGGATVALPLTNGVADTLINLVFVVTGGTTTKNPTVEVSLLVCDMAA